MGVRVMSFSPTRKLIASVNLVSDSTIISFTNISQEYDDLEIWLSSRAATGATGGGSVSAYFGGNVGSYSQRTAYGAGYAGTFGSSPSTTNNMRVGSSVNPGDAAGFSVDRAFIFNYSSLNADKASFARTAQPNRGATSYAYHLDAVSSWSLLHPVINITLRRDGVGPFAAGTRVNLYGIGR